MLIKCILLACIATAFCNAATEMEPASAPLLGISPTLAQPDFAPISLEGKTILLNYDQSIVYDLTRSDGGWNKFILLPDRDPASISFKGETAIIRNYATRKPRELFLQKIGNNTLILTEEKNPPADRAKIEPVDEHLASFLLHFTAKDQGIATIIHESYAGQSIITNISFTIKTIIQQAP